MYIFTQRKEVKDEEISGPNRHNLEEMDVGRLLLRRFLTTVEIPTVSFSSDQCA